MFPLVKRPPSIYFGTMKRYLSLSFVAGILFSAAGIFSAAAQLANPTTNDKSWPLLGGTPADATLPVASPEVVASAPTYVPDLTHQNDPLPDGVLAWDDLLKATDTTNGQDFARFVFNFTNVAALVDLTLVTNITATATNITTITNSITPLPVTILSVHPSCGCTTAELPPVPWTIPPGSNGQIKLAVNLAGKAGVVFKTVNIATDKGRKDLSLRITIAPPPPPRMMSETERAAAMAAAKVDRQAVFKGDCASCHSPKSPGIYGVDLYAQVCGVCHDAEHRASVVPDLHALKVPTNEEFWRTWISIGKPGSLMPAFAQAQGGPLTDLQVASLAAFLNMTFPSHATNSVGQ